MRSTFDILSRTFEHLKPLIETSITGNVYLHSEPDNSQKQNVIIGLINNPGDYVQSGFMNVNFSAMQVKGGRPNLKVMKTIVDKLLPVFDGTHVTSTDPNSPTIHYSIDDDKGLFKDQDIEGKYFYNIRIKFVTL